MNPRIKKLSMLLMLLIILPFAGAATGLDHVATNPLQKMGSKLDLNPSRLFSISRGKTGAYSRKLLDINIVLDYDYAGANGKHDPRGRKGGGGKNP